MINLQPDKETVYAEKLQSQNTLDRSLQIQYFMQIIRLVLLESGVSMTEDALRLMPVILASSQESYLLI